MLYYNELDKAREESVKARLEEAWKCGIHFYGPTNPIDAYAIRDGEVMSWLEVKCRKVQKDKYPTIYLSFRKWQHLMLAELHTERPGIFVVDFLDALCYTYIRTVDARNLSLLGRTDRGALNDLEPIIEVPIADLLHIN